MSEAVIIQFVFRKSASQSLNTGNIVTRSFTTYNYKMQIYQKFRSFSFLCCTRNFATGFSQMQGHLLYEMHHCKKKQQLVFQIKRVSLKSF